VEHVLRDLSVFGEPARIRLLTALEANELGVSELCRVVQMPQSTVSRHLKALQVAGWIRRRAEGTSGLFRADTSELEPERLGVWNAIRASYSPTLLAEEDRLRLRSVLDARTGPGFFSTRSAEWDGVRRSLFGDHFLSPAFASLLPRTLQIADLGCGTGVALVELAPWVARVIGVDREGAMLDAAALRLRDRTNVELRKGGLEALPLEDAEVDAAICLLVLHHVPNLEPVFAEAHRVLRPGGRLVVVDMMAHDREDWRHTMGHAWLGFDPSSLARLAVASGLHATSWAPLVVEPEADGPPLFLATFDRPL
jgi:SAM-dependent methyltransferase